MIDDQTERGAIRKVYANAKDGAQDAVEAIEGNPLGILVGGLALGAVVGALIPRSAREREMLAPIGRKLNATAIAAVAAARAAGREELDAQGLTTTNAKDRGRDLLDGVFQALGAAGSAAMKSTKAN